MEGRLAKSVMGGYMGNQTGGWIHTAPRFVAFLDIMGFKELVFRNDHDYVFGCLAKLVPSTELIKSREKTRYPGDESASFLNYVTKSPTRIVTFSSQMMTLLTRLRVFCFA